MKIREAIAIAVCAWLWLGGSAHGAEAGEAPLLSRGQTLYLPIYSHVWHGDVDRKGKPLQSLVSVLVSIRNTDMERPVRLMSAEYYSTEGKKLAQHVPKPIVIGPMGTHELYIPRSEVEGGSGANFIITWQSEQAVNTPIVEALHLNLVAARSIAFTTTARPIAPGK